MIEYLMIEEGKAILFENIKKLRKESGYTQQEVANLLNIDRSTYSCYEIGKIKPDVDTVVCLSQIFAVHYSQILECAHFKRLEDRGTAVRGCPTPRKRHGIVCKNSQEEELIVSFRLLPEDMKEKILRISSLRSRKYAMKI
ncbi:MAG: helix-turn-helix domain-containing protein [Acutalibacteraceae bacterium]